MKSLVRITLSQLLLALALVTSALAQPVPAPGTDGEGDEPSAPHEEAEQALDESSPLGELTVQADVRVRLDLDARSGTGVDPDESLRARPRLRARAGLVWETPLAGLSAGIRVATNLGNAGNSPHQTMSLYIGGAGYGLGLDRAFISYAFLDGFRVVAGKQASPFWGQTEAFWDEDIQPAGLLAGYDRAFGAHRVAAHVGCWLVDSSGWTSDLLANDTALGWQVRYSGTLEPIAVTVAFTGLSMFDLGPATNTDGTYVFGDSHFFVSSVQVGLVGLPVRAKVGFDYHFSTAEPVSARVRHGTGFSVQARVSYQWAGLRYYYYDIGEAAVPFWATATLAQDNFPNSRGGGLTGFTGHRVQLDLDLFEFFSVDLRAYIQEGRSENVFAFSETPGRQLQRVQLNVNVKY